jgi:hypothetical protein
MILDNRRTKRSKSLGRIADPFDALYSPGGDRERRKEVRQQCKKIIHLQSSRQTNLHDVFDKIALSRT